MVEYAHYDRLLTENATLKAEQARPRADLVERDENAGRLIDTLTRQRDEARTERDALKATLAVRDQDIEELHRTLEASVQSESELEAERDALKAALNEAEIDTSEIGIQVDGARACLEDGDTDDAALHLSDAAQKNDALLARIRALKVAPAEPPCGS